MSVNSSRGIADLLIDINKKDINEKDEKNINENENEKDKKDINEKDKKDENKNQKDENKNQKDISLTNEDIKDYLRAIIKSRESMVDFVIEGFNNLSAAMRNMVIQQFAILMPPFQNKRSTEDNKDIATISFDVIFENLEIKMPISIDSQTGESKPKYPCQSRIKFTNYTAPIILTLKAIYRGYDAAGKVIKEKTQLLENKEVASIPVMVRSNICTTGAFRHIPLQLINTLESPEDPGGYFIMAGNEVYIVNSENIKYNSPSIYFTTNAVLLDLCWLEIISKPGDGFENSHQVVIHLTKNGAIYVQIDAIMKHEQIPFYLIFRMLGITRDEDITKFIIHDSAKSNYNPTKELQGIIQRAYSESHSKVFSGNEYTQQEILKKICESNLSIKTDDEDASNLFVADISKKMDRQFLPHIGETDKSRYQKALYLGLLIQKLLHVSLGIIEPTNRDSYTNKRIHSAGISLAKAFKTHFNISVVQKIKKDLRVLFDSTDFMQVDIKSIKLNKENLEKSLAQAIGSSMESITIGTNVVPNRVPSVAVHRKNQLNTIVSARNIELPVSSGKNTTRAEEMREIQVNARPYTCPLASKDTGEKVGLTKELTITCYITPVLMGMSISFKQLILNDIIKLSDVRCEDFNKYGKVFINGDWLGFVEHPHLLVSKYREKRRRCEIDRYITIYWDYLYDEIYFWMDHGRLVCPFIIMDNNINEVLDGELNGKKIEFKQAPRLTVQHIEWLKIGHKDNKDYGIENLIQDGIIEYIAPEEMLNCFMAEDLQTAYANRNNIEKVFTHMEVPAACYGLSAHMGVLLNHNPPTRSTYETNQGKQTNGYAPLGWPFRMDKNMSYQVHCEYPIVRTIINDILMPNGLNVNIAYMCLDGKNQEDSIETDKSAIDRGWFWAAYWRQWQTDIKPNEYIRRPNLDDTMGIRKDSTYSKLNENGFIAPGTIVKYDDVLIAKSVLMPEKEKDSKDPKFAKIKYVDKAIVYKYDDPGIVEKITIPKLQVKQDGTRFVAVKTVSELPVCIGDKFSSRAGNKSINAASLSAGDMPFTATGTPISMISNAQTITSRMVVSQLIEGMIAKVCQRTGLFVDKTAFTDPFIDQYRIEAAKLGIQNVCLDQVYNGQTGDAVDCLICTCPIFIQRLQKFAEHEIYSNQNGPTDAITHQPTSGGRATSGGSRWGEMEKDAQGAHGCMNTLNEFFFNRSDGVTIYFCKKCGSRVTKNINDDTFICKTKDCPGDIGRINSSYSANLFMNEQFAMGIKQKLIPETFKYYK